MAAVYHEQQDEQQLHVNVSSVAAGVQKKKE